MNKLILAGTLGLLLAACATATDGADTMASEPQAATEAETVTQETTASVDAVGDPNEEICRRVEQTATRFTARVCKTRAEWVREAEFARQDTQRMQRGNAPSCAASGGC